ncbi:unnamed protein product [Rotaria sp. Silwood2]|nr:unnamed protein product [Rotaria sp. Silwood2]CAF2518388.1 unnamed protein product [Rotaria sp. Silwood2]CAF2915326.1 unnamed protein product [Rotaria sp. Silwood2]CAF3892334.1 unnamed protein product [Rotaria sp. Silwood2]CAF3960425.1 unnamed protein product [Rotaria sp. Silwood2]
MITTSTSKGPPNDDRTSDNNSNKDTSSSNYLQEDEDDPFTFRSRKSYPQRNNRPKLNYRDLERGLYDAHELRQSTWALGGPTLFEKNDRSSKNSTNIGFNDDEDEEGDRNANEENNEMLVQQNDKSSDDTEQMHRRLWCICKKPWDHSRVMLRCDSCANWYHGDCIGVTKEQARVLDMSGDQFVCPPCQGVTSSSGIKPGRSSDESLTIKRKHIDFVSPSERKVGERNGNFTSSKNLTNSEPSKRPKTGIFFQRDPLVEPQIHCIVHGCSNWAKSGWVYCSPACIRRHINDTLQSIQRSKGTDNDNPPSREDILLYENRTKKVLDRKLVPKIEDLCTWINQHPSYEIVKPALRQSILLTANEPKPPSNTGLVRSPSIVNPTTPKTPPTPNSNKPKLSWAPVVPNAKSVPIKKAPVQLGKPTTNTSSSSTIQNYADIRMKVPQALSDKLIMRLEKSGEKLISNEDIRIISDKIEEEMYRVYGKVDNSYKNKFRSLLANISNMNNNFFYKYILSKEVTAKQIVAMKAEDMLPPEEKEKRKDEFEKEVQMIIKAEEQTAEEMARRARTKITRQGLVDNDAALSAFKGTEQTSTDYKDNESKESKSSSTSKTNRETIKTENNKTSKPIIKTKKPINSTSAQKPAAKPKPKVQTSTPNKDTTSSHGQHTFDINCSICANTIPTKSTSPKPSPSIPTETIPQPTEPIPIKTVEEPPKLPSTPPVHEESNEASNVVFPAVDLDNDYIEPESPTGIDALLYDDDDDLNNISLNSRSSIVQQQHPESPGDNNECLPPAPQPIRDDYNPLAASKSKIDTAQMYQPTPIARSSSVTNQWRGVILPPDAKIPCQLVRTYGESDYLIGDIPEQLGILGRLRLGDLWDYVRESIAVRDVIILTLISSNNNESNGFSRYVDTMRASGRAAVINKRSDPSLIRDMYVLAADIKDCPLNVISTFSLSTNIDPKQLFLVVIGSGKRTKPLNRPNQSQSLSNITYKPVSLQETAPIRDPRLSRNKDPRQSGSNVTETMPTGNANLSIPQPTYTTNTKAIPTEYSTEDLLKLISESFDHIRHATSVDTITPTVMSTMELLKSSGREDLCARFTNDLHTIMSEWKLSKETTLTKAVITGDNLNEENMEVDDEQDDKQKKQLSISEYNDVDYRFLNQDMDHRITTTTITPENDHQNERRKDITKKSRFSDVVLSSHRDADDRTIKSNLMGEQREKRTTIIGNDSDFRTDDTKRTSLK